MLYFSQHGNHKLRKAIMLTLLFLPSLVFAKGEDLHLTPLALSGEFSSNKGVLLVHLDVDGSSPSIEIAKLSNKPALSKKAASIKTEKLSATNIDLSNKAAGFYTIALDQGWYLLTQINAPYFDLPFQLTNDNEIYWRFYVEKGKINYFGKLSIAKERGTHYVDAKRLNRIATDKTAIINGLPPALRHIPLRLSTGPRDDFLEALEK